jgi:hypothetical protein
MIRSIGYIHGLAHLSHRSGRRQQVLVIDSVGSGKFRDCHSKRVVIAANLSSPWWFLARSRWAFAQFVGAAASFAHAGAGAAANSTRERILGKLFGLGSSRMGTPKIPPRWILRGTLVLVLLLIGPVAVARAEKLPPLWGYGIKSCDEFLSATEGYENGATRMTAEYGRYEDWLTGLISGLNLATGQDVLRGADIQTAMRRIRAHCGGHRGDDFFSAAMDLVRMLSGLR